MLGLQPCQQAAGGGPGRLILVTGHHLTFPPEFIQDHYLSFLCIPALNRKGLFQHCTDELLQRKHVGVLFVCLGARCPVAGVPAGMILMP